MGEIHSFAVAPEREQPHSIDAEQQILGALLVGNDALPAIRAIIGPDAFYEPTHGRIFSTIARLVDDGRVASPVTLSAMMGDDPALKELGGPKYFARLAGASISTSLAEEYARLIAEKAEKRGLIGVVGQAMHDLHDDASAAGDVSARISSQLDAMDFKTTSVRPVSMMRAATDAVKEAWDVQQGAAGHYVQTGIRSLDNIVSGLGAGELWLLGGRPSMGKSAVAINIAMNAARAGHPVIFASLEMRPEQLAARAISDQTAARGQGVAYRDMRRPGLTDGQIDSIAAAATDVSTLPLWFLPREYASAELLPVGVKQSLRLYKGDKMPLVVVDYVQLMRSDKAKNRFEEITEVSLALKGLAMRQNLPILALSQLSRALESREEKRPMLSDLRESGQLEQDADGVMFAYREAYYVEREEPEERDMDEHAAWRHAMDACRNSLEIIVSKQRQGPIDTAKVNVNLAFNRIWER